MSSPPVPIMPPACTSLASCGLLSLLLGCAAGSNASSSAPPISSVASSSRAQATQPWDAPALQSVISIRDGHTGGPLSWDALLDRLEQVDVVFLGETHVDETTHRVELGVYDELLARREGRVVLALEMFERDEQDALDAYVRGESDEEQFIEETSPWAQYLTAYRPLIERARAGGLPVIGSNFPRPLLRSIAMEGPSVLDSLAPREAHWAPRELHANTAAYHRRADNAVRGHVGMMRRDESDPERIYGTQTLWDNAMGDACALALEEHPGSSVLHVNGSFHSSYWDGTVRQLELRRPAASVLTVSIVPTDSPHTTPLTGAPIADFVIFAEERARDLNDGNWAVHVDRELSYRLHVPDSLAPGQRVPLLIWLSDDGFDSTEGLALWKDRLGSEAILAVPDAPYRETQQDLGEGGRWFWTDTFPEDIAVMNNAVEELWSYVLRYYPVDPDRVCLAGEGTGATVVAAVSVLNARISADAVAFEPRRYVKIKDFPLPLPMDRGTDPQPARSLHLLTGEEDEAWWTTEVQEYQGIEMQASLARVTDDPWQMESERENALRAALELKPAENASAETRRHISLETDSERARLWARIEAVRAGRETGVAVAVLPASDAAALGAEAGEPASSEPIDLGILPGEGDRIPRCPGPFGGTTVLAVPASASPEARAAWLALEDEDPLARTSRFHRTRIAIAETDRDLRAVLEQLVLERRTNVLIVPAEFCATAGTMNALRVSTGQLADRMSLHWSPGLGGPGTH